MQSSWLSLPTLCIYPCDRAKLVHGLHGLHGLLRSA
jgi:hypothetical protein